MAVVERKGGNPHGNTIFVLVEVLRRINPLGPEHDTCTVHTQGLAPVAHGSRLGLPGFWRGGLVARLSRSYWNWQLRSRNATARTLGARLHKIDIPIPISTDIVELYHE